MTLPPPQAPAPLPPPTPSPPAASSTFVPPHLPLGPTPPAGEPPTARRDRRARGIILLSVLGLLVAAVVGCRPLVRAVQGPPTAAERVRDAAARTVEHPQLHFVVRYAWSAEQATMEGTADQVAGGVAADLYVTVGSETSPTESVSTQILVPDEARTFFMTVPPDVAPALPPEIRWLEVETGSASGLDNLESSVGTGTDMVFEVLRGLGEAVDGTIVRKLGVEALEDGRQATHYATTVPREELGASKGAPPADFPAEVDQHLWIDDAGLLAQVQLTLWDGSETLDYLLRVSPTTSTVAFPGPGESLPTDQVVRLLEGSLSL